MKRAKPQSLLICRRRRRGGRPTMIQSAAWMPASKATCQMRWRKKTPTASEAR
jgi:hypothetical protein